MVALYVVSFWGVPVHNLGTDSAGYVVQIRAASMGTLDLPGARPGVGAAGAFLAGTQVVAVPTAPQILSIVLVACLGLASASVSIVLFRLPLWTSVPIAVIVAAWGGTARLGAGYLANLLALLLFATGVLLAVVRGPRGPSVWVTALFTGAALAHPGLIPPFAAIVLLWVAVSIPALRRDRAAGLGLTSVEPVAVLAGPIGLRPHDVADFTGVRERFDERAAEIVRWIDPWITVPLLIAGLVVVRRVERSRGVRAAFRLGIAWLAIAAIGPLVSLVGGVPGYRTLLLGTPIPVLMGLAVVRLGGRARADGSGAQRGWRPTAALVVTCAVGLGVLMLIPFGLRARGPRPSTLPSARTVVAYLRQEELRASVILVTDPTDALGILDWKRRQNAVRALAPDETMLRVFVYLGDERQLLSGRPTVRRGDGAHLFNDVSRRTWPAVRDELDGEPVILVVRPWVRAATWARVARTATLVDEDLAVLRGPGTVGSLTPVGEATMDPVVAAGRSLGTIGVLALLGGGWSLALCLRNGWSGAVAAGSAPTLGLAVVLPAGVAAAALGLDPGGSVGSAATWGLGALGWGMVWFARVSARGGHT